jgi:hypothetical protein
MAGTLTISTLSDGTNSTSATNCIQGSAKAWINYKGTATVAIRASYNVSSVTVTGTGQYTVNFTNAFADANYAAVISGQDPAGGSFVIGRYQGTWSTTAIQIVARDGSAYYDDPIVTMAVFR